MRTQYKVIACMLLSLFVIKSHAIQIKVKATTSADKIAGSGFTFNGKEYGALGSSYSAKNLPGGCLYFWCTYWWNIRP